MGLNKKIGVDSWNSLKMKLKGRFLRPIVRKIFGVRQLPYNCLEAKKVKNNLDKDIKLCHPKKLELFLSK